VSSRSPAGAELVALADPTVEAGAGIDEAEAGGRAAVADPLTGTAALEVGLGDVRDVSGLVGVD